MGPELSVHLIESQIKGVKKGRDQLSVSVFNTEVSVKRERDCSVNTA